MSIVLDALRKAEAERARGEVPGLHSAIAPAAVPLPASPTSTLPWQGVALGAGALLALVGLVIGAGAWWRWVQADVARPDVARAAAETTARPAPTPALVLTPTPAPAQTASPPINRAAPVTASASASTVRPVAPPTVAAAPAASPAALPAKSSAASPAKTLAASTAASQAGAPASAVPVPSAIAPPADGKPVALADLPDEIRRELPPLSVGGLIQMDDPPRRSLIINGAIVMEGEAVQPGLLLERIGSAQATLRYKGWRFLLGI